MYYWSTVLDIIKLHTISVLALTTVYTVHVHVYMYMYAYKLTCIITCIMNALAVQNPRHKCDLENNLKIIQSVTDKKITADNI